MVNSVFIILEKWREWRSPWEDDRRESQLALLHSNLRHEGPEARGVWQALCDYMQRGVWHALVKDDDWIWPGRWELLLLCVRFMMRHAAFFYILFSPKYVLLSFWKRWRVLNMFNVLPWLRVPRLRAHLQLRYRELWCGHRSHTRGRGRGEPQGESALTGIPNARS